MSFIYSISDIHGELDILQQTLRNIDLSNNDNKLILLGDYIDRGCKSCQTLYFIKDLCEKYPKQVIALRGNHEEMFLEQFNEGNLFTITDYEEIQNYLSENELSSIVKKFENLLSVNEIIYNSYKEMIFLVKSKHKELINWLKTLPYYYETENQIFIHAGVNEECGEEWKIGSENEDFVWKYPYTTGYFYKDIIAGHISTASIINNDNYYKVFWDEKSHFYIDGMTNISKIIPILKYDTVTGKYTSFEKVKNGANCSWQEYVVK